MGHTSWDRVGGVLISLSRPWARRRINHLSLWRIALPVRRQTYGYLPSRRASPPIDRYRVIPLDDRGTCVWTICPRLLPESGTARSRTRDLLCREANALTITPPGHTSSPLTLTLTVTLTLTYTLTFNPRQTMVSDSYTSKKIDVVNQSVQTADKRTDGHDRLQYLE